MESKFIPTLHAGNGYTYLKLKGILDEDNLLANLLSQIQGRLLLIDMAEIFREVEAVSKTRFMSNVNGAVYMR